MHYTINHLLLLKDEEPITLNPNKYQADTKIGDELLAFLQCHLDSGESWPLGATKSIGPHSFMLSMNPNTEILRFWTAVKQNQWKIKMGCSGNLRVIQFGGEVVAPPPDVHYTIPLKPYLKESMDSFIKKRIKRLYP